MCHPYCATCPILNILDKFSKLDDVGIHDESPRPDVDIFFCGAGKWRDQMAMHGCVMCGQITTWKLLCVCVGV